MKRLPVVLMILSMTAGGPVEGQRLPAEFPRYHPRPAALQQPDTLPKVQRPKVKDYTLEGAAIGGLTLGVFGAYFGGGMCGMSDQAGKDCTLATLMGFLPGAAIGATIGGIVGSAKKKAPAEERPPVPVRADSALFPRAASHGGNGAALGAVMIGGGVAVLSTLGCSLDQSGGHEDCAWKAVKRGTIGAVIGGLTGALVGAVLSPTPSPRRGPQ